MSLLDDDFEMQLTSKAEARIALRQSMDMVVESILKTVAVRDYEVREARVRAGLPKLRFPETMVCVIGIHTTLSTRSGDHYYYVEKTFNTNADEGKSIVSQKLEWMRDVMETHGNCISQFLLVDVHPYNTIL